MANRFPGKPFYHSTLLPKSDSTDNWTTTGNQTALNDTYPAINAAIKAKTAPIVGYVDTCVVLESSPGSRIWNPANTPLTVNVANVSTYQRTLTATVGTWPADCLNKQVAWLDSGTPRRGMVTTRTSSTVITVTSKTAPGATSITGAQAWCEKYTADGLHPTQDAEELVRTTADWSQIEAVV